MAVSACVNAAKRYGLLFVNVLFQINVAKTDMLKAVK